MAKLRTKLDENYPEVEQVMGRVDVIERAEQSSRPGDLVIGLGERDRLSKLLGRNLLTANDLVAACERLTTCNVDGISITIEPGLLIRLKSRAIRKSFPEYLREVIIRMLHAEVGW